MRARVQLFLWLLLLSGGGMASADIGAAQASLEIAASAPPDAPPDLKRLIGEYRAADVGLTIYEADGKLHAEGLGLHHALLRRLGPSRFSVEAIPPAPSTRVEFELNRDGPAAAVTVGASRLQYEDIGEETVRQIRAGVSADSGRLRAAALAATPPTEPPPKRSFDLVDLATVDPGIKFDIRYATSNNFLGFPLYELAAAYLQRPAAEALGRVQRSLAAKGYGLLIHDGYRPWFVTKMFWEATPESAHGFVADPSEGSRHNRGCAVDLTMYDLKSGKAVEMTGRYDEMSPRSYVDYPGGTSRQRWLRDLLRSEMAAQGFTVYDEEWWHFDYQDWSDYAIGTATFTQLRAGT